MELFNDFNNRYLSFKNEEFNFDLWTDNMILFFIEYSELLMRDGFEYSEEAKQLLLRYKTLLTQDHLDTVVDCINEILYY